MRISDWSSDVCSSDLLTREENRVQMMDKNMKILLVDDVSTIRRIVRNLLGDLGYTNITEADDGKTAWPLLQASSFDFVVTDWNMPGMTGIELLRNIRGDARIGKTPVLMVTAEAQREQIIDRKSTRLNSSH